MTSNIVLQGGTVLYHDDDDSVIALKNTDILVTGNLIAKIGTDIEVPSGATVIDCKGKIVSPGFIDTHHHLWQAQLKGRHVDETLLEYVVAGNMQSYNYTPEDMFWGQLASCLEAIDAGTTYVLDHAHGIYTPEHATQSISATTASGLRSTYAYAHPPATLDSWTDTSIAPSSAILPAWSLDQLESLALAQPHASGRLTIGLGFDFFYLPREMVIDLFARFRKAGVQLITSHVAKNAVFGTGSTVELLDSYGLLGPDLVVSHATNLTAGELKVLHNAGVYISSTPSSEAQTALGWPVALRSDVHGSLGVDSHGFSGASIISEAWNALLAARHETNSKLLEKGEFPEKLAGGTREAFNLATVGGARAVGMGDKIGRIREGYLADLVVIDARSPGMAGVSGWDPVIAVLGYSHAGDVDTVIVDGIVRKRGGKLLPVKLDGGETLEWDGVAERVERSRIEVQKRIEGVSFEAAKKLVVGAFHIDESKLKVVDY